MGLRAAVLAMVAVVAAADFTVVDRVITTGDVTVHAKVLTELEKGHPVQEAVIIWDVGGRVEALSLRTSTGTSRNILATHDNNATAIKDNVNWKGAMLAPFANRIANGTYTFQGVTHYLPRNEERCNGTCDCALHGFLFNKTMTLVGTTSGASETTLTLSYNFDGTDQGYPFKPQVTLKYTMRSNYFSVQVSVHNPSATDALPFYHGWHPYFAVSDVSKTIIEFDNCTGWNHVIMGPGAPRDGTLIPTGKTQAWTKFDGSSPIGGNSQQPTYFDDEFKATAPPAQCPTISQRIIDPAQKDAVVLWGDSSFRVWQLFTGAREKWGESALAMEPQSALCDGFNNYDHLSILSGGETYSGTFGIHLDY